MKKTMKSVLLCGLLSIAFLPAAVSQDEQKMDFEAYDPPSTMVTPEHHITRAKFPFIDVHNHQFNMPTMDLSTLITEMDKMNMKVMVNLSGRGRGTTEHLEKSLENVNKNYKNRFIVFTNIDFSPIDDPEWQGRILKQLENDVKMGANGLKIYTLKTT